MRSKELTRAEKAVVNEAIKGGTRKEIGLSLNISWQTVRSHLSAAYKKLGVKNRIQLALKMAEMRRKDNEGAE